MESIADTILGTVGVRVQVRSPNKRVTDLPEHEFLLPLLSALDKKYVGRPTSELRACHFDYMRFLYLVKKYTTFDFDSNRDSMTVFISAAADQDREKVITIRSEFTFHHALSNLRKGATVGIDEWSFFITSPKMDVSVAMSPRPTFGSSPVSLVVQPKNTADTLPNPTIAYNGTIEEITIRERRPSLPHLELDGTITTHTEILDDSLVQATVRNLDIVDHDVDMENEKEPGLPGQSRTETIFPEEDQDPLSYSGQDLAVNPLATGLSDLVVPEREDDETEEDFQDRLKLYNDMISELNAAIMSQEVGAFNNNDLTYNSWPTTCKFFNHPVNLRSPKPCVKVKGFARSLLPAQAHSIYRTFVMLQRSSVGHCFHGHAMGVGKTTIAIFVHCIQHRLNLMWNDIAKHPNKHCATDVSIDLETQCPSNHDVVGKYGFDCPCAGVNVSSQFAARYGPTVMLAPLTVLSVWAKEWRKCFGIDQVTSLKVPKSDINCVFVRAHGDAKPITGETWTNESLEIACAISNDSVAADSAEIPALEHNLSSSRLFIVTTAQSFPGHVAGKFQVSRQYSVTPPSYKDRKGRLVQPRAQQVKKTWNTLLIGSVWIDEAHSFKNKTSYVISLLATSPILKPRIVPELSIHPMSGTLVSTGVSDIANYLTVMAQFSLKAWREHPTLRYFCGDKAVSAGKEWDSKMRNGKVEKSDIKDHIALLKILLEATSLRFSPQTEFLDAGPIITLPPNHYHELPCKHPDEWNKALRKFKASADEAFRIREKKRKEDHMAKYKNLDRFEQGQRQGSRPYYCGRQYATFPYLMVLEQTMGVLLTQSEWAEKRKSGEWNDTDSPDPYEAHLHSIVASSGKIKRIEYLLDRWNDGLDGEGKPFRQIFCSEFFVIARILYLFMIKVRQIPASDIVWIHKPLGQKEIDSELDRFRYGKDEKSRPRYIIATVSSFGIGVTLSEAVSVCLLEPQMKAYWEDQVFGRHSRMGNKNKELFSVLLYHEGNEIEEKTLNINRIRKNLVPSSKKKISD